jgi:pentatricopeptide repeat protein
MERDGVAGNISTVNLLVGIGVEVAKCLDLAVKWGLRLNGYTYKCILQVHLRSREVSKGFQVYDEMRRKGYKLDIFAYNMLLDALAKAGMVRQLDIFTYIHGCLQLFFPNLGVRLQNVLPHVLCTMFLSCDCLTYQSIEACRIRIEKA